ARLLAVVTALAQRLGALAGSPTPAGPDDPGVAAVPAGPVASADPAFVSLGELVAAAGELPVAIDGFFDALMVMDPDPAVRVARLGLLARIRDLTAGTLDWEALGSLPSGH
ncbi:glycine--tRNA ligase subunit alpha/beta, partial [Frankia sp. AiPs1]|nr:glycine--tRNA ligase subunit alpha/beta [Frankia sp. AiPs1]